MFSRRGILGMVAATGMVAVSKPAVACETDEPIKDPWGPKLTTFFRTGDPSVFKDQLSEDVSLVSFEKHYTGSDKLAFEGPADVATALIALRSFLLTEALGSPRVFKAAKLSEQLYTGKMNKLSLTFGIENEIQTSCGLTTAPNEVDLLYESEFEAKQGSRLPGLKRLAVVPPTSPSGWFRT